MFEEDIDTDYYNSDLESAYPDDVSVLASETDEEASDSDPPDPPAPALAPAPAAAPAPISGFEPDAESSRSDMDYFDRLTMVLSDPVPIPPAHGPCMCV